jgi:hypothetical protein
MQIESQIVTHESDILPSNYLETLERKNMAVVVDNDMDVEGVLKTKSSDILSLSTLEKLPIPTSDRVLRSAEQRKRSKRLLEDSESGHNLMSNKQRGKAVASIISKVISESMLIVPVVQTEEQIAPKASVTKSVRKPSAKAEKIAIQNEIQEEIKAEKKADREGTISRVNMHPNWTRLTNLLDIPFTEAGAIGGVANQLDWVPRPIIPILRDTYMRLLEDSVRNPNDRKK